MNPLGYRQIAPFRHQRKGAAWLYWVLLAAFGLTRPGAYAHGELDIRIAAATAEIAKATNKATLYLSRGELYREHKDWPAAAADYDTASRLDPTLPQIDFLRGRMLIGAGQFDRAQEILGRHLAHHPEDGLAYIERARVLVLLNLRTNAVADYSRGIELLESPRPEFFVERAQAFLDDRYDEAAVRSLDEGVKRLGPVVSLQALAMDLELKQKKFDAALARLETIIPQTLRPERWLTQRGEIQLQASRPAEANRSFEAALAAIARLPMRLQTLPPMLNLKARIQTLQAGITNSPAEPSQKILEKPPSSK